MLDGNDYVIEKNRVVVEEHMVKELWAKWLVLLCFGFFRFGFRMCRLCFIIKFRWRVVIPVTFQRIYLCITQNSKVSFIRTRSISPPMDSRIMVPIQISYCNAFIVAVGY